MKKLKKRHKKRAEALSAGDEAFALICLQCYILLDSEKLHDSIKPHHP